MAYNICKYGNGSGGGGGDERPDGSTVTPVSDISTWLRCGGLGSKGYTTLSQVLDDSTTLDGLMSDANAVNYLVRSTVWVSDITSNSNAMTYIGANDYAAYKLLSNNTWLTAICNSSYFESVLTTKVPTMTSNTAPSGECYFDGTIHSGVAYYPYDSVSSTYVQLSGNSSAVGYSRYRFSKYVTIFRADVSRMSVNGTSYVGEISGSIDGTTWDMLNFEHKTDYTNNVFILETNGSYYQYRVKLFHNGGSQYDGFVNVQFYGRTFGNVQSWLKAGKVDKNYTTLEQVLADSSTLQALMTSSDAVDYLSTCGNWVNMICANQNAMTYIGANNYAANTLLSNSAWLNAIVNSQYINSVLNIKVPTMTSNTTPSGECISNGVYNSNYANWKAFDNTNTGEYDAWVGPSGNTTGWLGYHFTQSVPIVAFVITNRIFTGSIPYISSANIENSNDGSNWSIVSTYTGGFPTTSNGSSIFSVPASSHKSYWRINILSSAGMPSGYTPYLQIGKLQFYGHQDV